MFFDMLNSAIGGVVGSFVGFVGALYLRSRADKQNKKNKSKLVLQNISDEISDISSVLVHYLETEKPLNYNIQTPNWDAVLYSGLVLEFIENPLYAQTINIYSRIKHFNDSRTFLNKTENLNEIRIIVDKSKSFLDKK